MVQVVVCTDSFLLFPWLLVLLRSPFCFFLGHSNAGHEIEKPLAVAMWWDGTDLLAVVAKTLPKMLGTLDEAVLDQLETS